MDRHNTGLWLLLVVILLTVSVSSANGFSYHFKHINSKDGLPHQQVEALAQDKDGYVWIGTRNGLAQYDGYEMRCFYHEPGNERSLANSFVKKLLADSKGRIWACTPDGLCRYESQTNDFNRYSSETEYILSILEMSDGRIVCAGNGLFLYDEKGDSLIPTPVPDSGYILSLAVDNKDNLYFATNSELFYYDHSLKRLTRMDHTLYEDFLTGADGVVPMMVDHAGQLWVGRNGKGVACINLSTWEVKIFFPTELVRCIEEDSEHSISFGTENGVLIINADGTEEVIRHDISHPGLISDNAIYALLTDVEGNHWVGSYFGGVDIKLSSISNFRWMEPGREKHHIPGRVLRSMVETEPGILWIATEDSGLVIVDLKSGQCQPFTRIPSIGRNIHSLYYDRESQNMWIGTFRNGLFRYNLKTGATRRYLRERGLDSDAIFHIARQQNGRLWMATTQGLRYYDGKSDMFMKVGDPQLDIRFIYTLLTDHADNLWVGTADVGLFRIDGKNDKITHWEKGRSGLYSNYITCLYEDSRGTICIGTNVNGLHYIHKDHGNSINTFGRDFQAGHTTSRGVSPVKNYTICSLIEDADGKLWMSTNQGLLKLDVKTGGVIRFTTDNGLPTNQFNFGSSLRGHDGRLYFGTVQGLVSFNPAQMNSTSHRHVVHWKQLLIGNQLVPASIEQSSHQDTPLLLTYDQARQFTIGYGVVSPAAAGIVRYQVKVDGIDREWRDVGTLRQFNGYRLAPGSYVLHVRANEEGGDWSLCAERRLEIIVGLPWWLSWSALLVYLLLLSAIAYFLWHYYRSRQQSRDAIRQAALENEKIRAIDQAKFEFFTSVSHELKTPLTLIEAPLKTIQRQESLGSEGSRNLDIALKNTRKIEALVDELVTYNKVETDAFRLYVQQGNPMEFLSKAASAFRGLAKEKSINLSLRLEDNGEQVWFSPQYLEHIAGNLLSNALKFTPEGGSVTVRGAVVSDSDSRLDYLRIEVADTGIGIVPEELDHIFNRYYQTRRGHNMASSGWGIGLSLVERLAQIHHGTVSVESEVGKGSTFRVMLCVSESAFDEQNRIVGDKVLVPVSDYKFHDHVASDAFVAHPSHDETKPGDPDEEKATLLLVDDHAEMLDYLCTQLSVHYRVLTAGNGREALSIARSEIVHLVVSDVMMPEMDGFELCRLLKGNMDTSHLPVILLTAKSESGDVATGYRAGADAYVSKPFDVSILEMQIGNILRLIHLRQQEMVQAGSEDDLSAASLTVLDRDFLHRMKCLVDENLGNSDFSVSDITGALGISRSLLHVKMRSLMNMSMGDYIRHQRMEKACRMLREGNNVSETAYATGFADPNYFSRTFKKCIGISPTEYQKDKST